MPSVAASAFSLSSIVDLCGETEHHGGEQVDEVRRLLAAEVDAGRLQVAYVVDCPECRNVIGDRDHLPTAPFEMFCEFGDDHSSEVIDPATAHAIFVNVSRDPALERWV